MNYIQYKELETKVVESKSIPAMAVLTEQLYPHINKRINSYKYTHSDLTGEEMNKLFQLNSISSGALLQDGEVYEVVNGKLTKTKEIDLFKILSDIQTIIYMRN